MELHAEHMEFGAHFEAPLRADWQAATNTKDPARQLRIGFVSADLYDHALTNFLEPVFKALAVEPSLVMHAYHTNTHDDATTLRLRSYFAQWHACASVPDEALAAQIRADGIDILIDLTGHTAHNRLLTFARKPAPVQVSWLGYLGTTGLQAMDYFLCDDFWIPSGVLDWQLCEKTAYLPCPVVFQPSELAPAINGLPALHREYITFGSFNRPNKLNQSVIVLWSMLLKKVPQARMLLIGMPQNSQETLMRYFAQEGIALDRLDFHPRSDLTTYLALHNQVDLCLDTFPFGGGATNAHAAWMGLPTLCLAGDTPASRFGSAMMHQLGLDEFIATDIEDFVTKGVYWSQNLTGLAGIRQGMRGRFLGSSLGQPGPFASHLITMLRTMWRRWCINLPAAAISIAAISPNDDASPKMPNGLAEFSSNLERLC
jgi:predicted O-linked N-acetylglucosamine transferase (SPINDLY family)